MHFSAIKENDRIDVIGEKLVEDPVKAEFLNEFFSEVGADRKDDVFDEKHAEEVTRYVSGFDFEEDSDDQTNDCFDEIEVTRGLRELNAHKAMGPDEIHNRFLIEGGHEVVVTLVQLFNESWKSGVLPKAWKRAEVSPIPKHSGAATPDKLRPISLLSVVEKLMDKLVAQRLSTRAEKERWFPGWQGGFRPGRAACSIYSYRW